MRLSGYSQEFRYQVIKSGIEGFEKMRAVELAGGVQLIDLDLMKQTRDSAEKNYKRAIGLEKVATRFPCLYPTHLEGS